MNPCQIERRAASLSLGVTGGFAFVVLGSGKVPMLEFLSLQRVYAESLTALALLVGSIALFGQCGKQGLRDGGLPSPFGVIGNWLSLRWSRDRMLSVLTPPLVCMVSLATFNSFKQLVLPSAGFGLDPLLADIDRALFFGKDPWVLTHAVLGSVAATKFVDGYYHGWFVPMILGIIVCPFVADTRLRYQYTLTYLFMWIVIGCGLAWLLPSAGPAYFQHFHGSGQFGPLMAGLLEVDEQLKANGGNGLAALQNQAALLAHFNSQHLVLGGGISAMPSMHNAMAVLFALGAMRLNRWFGILMWIYAFLIWIASVHLGWHYAIDGVVAALATVTIWFAAGRTLDWFHAAKPRHQSAIALAE